jgi:hypothetical protein
MTEPFASIETEAAIIAYCNRVGHLSLENGRCQRCLAYPDYRKDRP